MKRFLLLTLSALISFGALANTITPQIGGGIGQFDGGLGNVGNKSAIPVTVLQSIQRVGNGWTFTFQRSGSTAASRTDNWVVSGSSLNGKPALASDFGGTFPSGVATFAIGSATTTVTITPTTNVEPN